MNNSQTIEPEGGDATSPPPLPGRSAPFTSQELSEVFIALAFGDVTEDQVSDVLGLPVPPGFLKIARANGTRLVTLAISKRAESEGAERRSDPGNNQTEGPSPRDWL